MHENARDSNLTIRLDPRTKALLDHLAAATDRSRAFLVLQALKRYLAAEAWQVQAAEQGIQQADSGDFADEAEVRAILRRWHDAS
jgi:RHH-type rel operon transcriptional repressor/antitoxin RelB